MSYLKTINELFLIRRPIIGFYTPRIHTVWDKVASFENIEFIANILKDFVDKLGEDNV